MLHESVAPNPVRAQRDALYRRLVERDRRDQMNAKPHWFPDDTHQWRGHTYYDRALYPKHLEFFAAGREYRERCFLAGNRIGKTITGAYELTCHLTGDYPDWWEGYRVERMSPRAWAAGKTNETTRDIIQTTLLGGITYRDSRKTVTGTGMIPGRCIGQITWKQGVADMIDTVLIHRLRADGTPYHNRASLLGFKSYQQGRGSFEGTAQDVIWLDEEPPEDVYSECLTRTATTQGRVICTFTPLEGLSEVTMRFMPQEDTPE